MADTNAGSLAKILPGLRPKPAATGSESGTREVLSILFSAVLPLLGFLVLSRAFDGRYWFHEPLHSTLDAGVAFFALTLGLLVMIQARFESETHYAPWAAAALIGMGTLDFAHAGVHLGEGMVWGLTLSNLVAGLLFSFVWVPRGRLSREWARRLPVMAGVFGLAGSTGLFLFGDHLPRLMVIGESGAGVYSSGAKVLSFLSALGFYAAAAFFLRQARHSDRNALAFANQCLLLGTSTFLFPLSHLWRVDWWYWHGLRFVGCLAVLRFLFNRYQAIHVRLRASHGELELRVRERTVLLADREERLRLALESAKLGSWDMDLRSGALTWSDRCYEQFGVPRSQPLTYNLFLDRVHPEDRQRVKAHEAAALEKGGGGYFDLEYRVRENGSDGVRWLRSSGRVYFDDAGRPMRALGTIRDITGKRRAEEAASRAQARMLRMMETSAMGIAFGSVEGRVFEANDVFLTLTGYGREELSAGTFNWRQLLPDGVEAVESFVRRELESRGRCGPLEGEIKRRDGTRVPVLVSFGQLPGCFGETVAFVMDCTERQRAQHALRISEERFLAAEKGAQAGIFEWEAASGKVYLSPGFWAILGHTPEEITDPQRNWEERLHPEDRERLWRNIGRALGSHGSSYQGEYRLRHRDGTYRWVLARGTIRRDAEGKPERVLGTHIDITQRKRTELELAESRSRLALSEERYRSLVVATSSVVWTADSSGAMETPQASWEAFTGQPWEEQRERGWLRALHPEDREKVGRLFSGDGKETVRECEGRLWHGPSSRYRYVLARAVALLDGLGSVREWIGNIVDIDDRRQAEELVKVSEGQLRHALEAARMVAWSWDPKTNLINRSPNSADILGLQPGQTANTLDQYLALVHPEDRFTLKSRVEESMAAHGGYKVEYRMIRPVDGRVIWAEDHATVTYDESGKVARVGGVLLDITERREAEQEIRHHAERLARSNAELEQFAYIASHDLKEPLRTVTNYAQLLSRLFPDKLGADGNLCLRYITDGTRRMYGLINDLLEYSRAGREDTPLMRVDTGAALDTALNNLHEAIAANEAVVEREPLPLVLADQGQLTQLFQNLISNAVKYRSSQAPRIRVRARREPREYVFSVEDNGIGIEPKYFERVFVLFQRLHGNEEFSGTGIGLSICKRIVVRHGGRIWVESQPGKGSTFYFTLPRREEGDGDV